MIYKAYLMNSLDTVFVNSEIKTDSLKHTGFFRNEAFSFQIALRADIVSEGTWNDTVELRAEIESELKDKITLYTVENVPAMHVGYKKSDDWFLKKDAGLYPDRLQLRKNNYFSLLPGYWKSIWININEETEKIPSKSYKISIKFYNRANNQLVAKREAVFEVLNKMLPKQSIVATNWVHYDCMAYFSNTKPFSKSFFNVAEKYIRMAAKNGQNMILTPVFPPPLDTPVGEERMTVQLVRIKKENNKYFFDFSYLKHFIEMCKKCGIEYFEHSHLYTQWGAEHAPKIIVSENGKNKKMFGWHTNADSDEYREFLHAYISELKNFLKVNGYEKIFFFHISDEPSKDNMQSYKKASDFIHGELGELPNGDALSDYTFYENGLVQTPIAATDEIESFIGRAKPLWAYYTGLQSKDNLSNRLIGMPQERGRILGAELYYFNIQGFLNWGFNAHHNRLSRMMTDPRISSDMDGDFPSGTSYLVYPNGNDVEASVRLMTFRDQMQDIRALKLLESITDRKTVCDLIKTFIPNISFKCRTTAEEILELRNEINRLIAASGK